MVVSSAARAYAVFVQFATLSGVCSAAVDDGLIAKSPCSPASAKPPAAGQRRVVPCPTERVEAVTAALPEPYQAVAVVAAGLGLRQGEAFGLGVDDVDFLRRVVHVRRQVKIVGGQLVFAPPKTGKERDAPPAESLALRLAAQLRAFPAAEVTLPWLPTGKPTTAKLIFPAPEGGALRRPTFNSVADWLGHADPDFTLRMYGPVMPASEDRTRAVVDAAFNSSVGAGAPNVAHEGR